jgi:hypothetical protein
MDEASVGIHSCDYVRMCTIHKVVRADITILRCLFYVPCNEVATYYLLCKYDLSNFKTYNYVPFNTFLQAS